LQSFAWFTLPKKRNYTIARQRRYPSGAAVLPRVLLPFCILQVAVEESWFPAGRRFHFVASTEKDQRFKMRTRDLRWFRDLVQRADLKASRDLYPDCPPETRRNRASEHHVCRRLCSAPAEVTNSIFKYLLLMQVRLALHAVMN